MGWNDYYYDFSVEKRTAAAEALESFKKATAERRRSHIYAESEPGQPLIDVTEEVVNLLDMITTSMDCGSDFWTDTDLPAFIRLCTLLKFEEIPAKGGR